MIIRFQFESLKFSSYPEVPFHFPILKLISLSMIVLEAFITRISDFGNNLTPKHAIFPFRENITWYYGNFLSTSPYRWRIWDSYAFRDKRNPHKSIRSFAGRVLRAKIEILWLKMVTQEPKVFSALEVNQSDFKFGDQPSFKRYSESNLPRAKRILH